MLGFDAFCMFSHNKTEEVFMTNKILNFLNTHDKEMIKAIDSATKLLDRIKEIYFGDESNEALQKLSLELKQKAKSPDASDELLVYGFCLVKEAIFRVLHIKPYDCQILAGIHLHNKKLIEMQTGEGKTLAAVFPAYIKALDGKGVHILTFNDYLAKRDAAWMGPIFNFLGLSVGYVSEGMSNESRKRAYACDVTYVTAKEAGFDYLRDSICYESTQIVHRPFNYAIIDEADSIMIDEARIPLVIAAADSNDAGNFYELFNVIRRLEMGLHYKTDEALKNVYLTDKGIKYIETEFSCGNLYDENNLRLVSEINSALQAEVLLKKDRDYIVRGNKIELVDEFTGRVAQNRHWPDRLQTAVEVKEGIYTADKGRVLSSISLQSFLGIYPEIAGMTGTAASSKDEFMNTYGMETISVPLNRPCIRIDYDDLIYSNSDTKFIEIIKHVIEINKTGRPILIGTANIIESEKIAQALWDNGLPSKVLNAKNDELEASIVADAGVLGSITVSTNMAGRGTDIKLGGKDEIERKKVIELGGLHVIGTSRHESIRIDNQLRGRAGRQGDPGTSVFFISLDDPIISNCNIKDKIINKYLKSQCTPIRDIKVIKRISQLQRITEGINYDVRKTLYKYSKIVEVQRKIIFGARHDILTGRRDVKLLKSEAPELYEKTIGAMGYEKTAALEKKLTLYVIDRYWADYLENITRLRDGIHLLIVGGKDPLEEFHFEAAKAFDLLQDNIKNEIVNIFKDAKLSKEGINLDINELKGPSATWTYLVTDNPFEDNLGLMLVNNRNIGFSAVAAGIPTISINLLAGLIYQKFIKKSKHIE